MKTILRALAFSVLVRAAVLAVPIVLGLARTATGQTDWEKAASGKMEFEVASVHFRELGEFTPPNFALDTGNGPVPPGSRLHVVFLSPCTLHSPTNCGSPANRSIPYSRICPNELLRPSL